MKNEKENKNMTSGSAQKEVKIFTRDELNKIVNAETKKALEKYKEQKKEEIKIKSDKKLLQQLKKEKAQNSYLLTELKTYQLKEKAMKIASKKGLDVSLLDLINYKSSTITDVNRNIENIIIAFNKAVEKAVKEKLREDTPIT